MRVDYFNLINALVMDLKSKLKHKITIYIIISGIEPEDSFPNQVVA